MTETVSEDEIDFDRHVTRRVAFLSRKYNLSESRARTLAVNEMGYSASGIAIQLDMTESTVKAHLRKIEDELGLRPLVDSPPIPDPEADLNTTRRADQ